MRRWKMLAAVPFAGALALASTAVPAMAADATYLVKQPKLRDGFPTSASASDVNWYRADTSVGGGVTLTDDFGGPDLGGGDNSALALTTNHQSTAKAQLLTLHNVFGAALTDVGDISYWTYQSSLSVGDPSVVGPALQLQIDTNGIATDGGFTTLNYEPYQNDTEGGDPQQPLAPDVWQPWLATEGDWWSSRQITCGAFSVAPGAGGPPFTTPAEIAANCPGAQALTIGVDVGTGPTNWVVGVDGVSIDIAADTFTWNFVAPK